MADLSDVTMFIKSFLRLGLLADCLAGIERNLPECSVVVVDDSIERQSSVEVVHVGNRTTIFMPFDSGFGAKSNRGMEQVRTQYVLIGSDDFDFSTPAVRDGIMTLLRVLEEEPSIAIASGRVDDNPYEAVFEIDAVAGTLRERAGYHSTEKTASGIPYRRCDLTVNFSLIRTSMLQGTQRIGWDDDVKIGGGEHPAFFLDVLRAGHGVCYVPGVDIGELPYHPDKVDPRYFRFRGRANQPGRICLRRRGIVRHQLRDGTWEATATTWRSLYLKLRYRVRRAGAILARKAQPWREVSLRRSRDTLLASQGRT